MECGTQYTIGPHGLTTTAEAGEPASTSTPQDLQDQFEDTLHRLPGPQAQLQRKAREFFMAKNRSVAKDGQARDQRFLHRGVLEPSKTDADDGYVSDDDCIAVLFDVTAGGPNKRAHQYRVYFGNVGKVTYDKVGKRVPGPRAHLTEESGEAVCKWFEEKLDASKKQVLIEGKRAYHLTLNNPTGFNEKVEFPNILTAVRMTLDSQQDCWLLDEEDYQYADTQMKKYSKYHNGTAAYRKGHGEWHKDVRNNHDKLKTKVSAQLGIVI